MTARLDDDGRCVATDLLPEMCGCPDHRGGQVIKDAEPHAMSSRRRDEHDHGRDQWGSPMFAARWPGVCGWCETPFAAESMCRYDAKDTLVGPCCAEHDMGAEYLASTPVTGWQRGNE